MIPSKDIGLYKTENPIIAAGFLCKYTKYEIDRYTFSILEYCLMKKILFLLVLVTFLSCVSDDDARRNPFLVDVSFQAILNTDLPQFSSLNFANNSVIVRSDGIRGFVVYHVGNDQFFAYELSDPNHSPNSCSTMTVSGITATCGCPDDNNAYNIVTGEHNTDSEKFPMKAYRATRNGNRVIVSN